MGFVIQCEDVFHPHQIGHDSLQHLAFGFERVEFVTAPALQELAASLGELNSLAQLKRMVVRDHDLGPTHVFEHIIGNKFAIFIVAVGIIGLEDSQAVLDG